MDNVLHVGQVFLAKPPPDDRYRSLFMQTQGNRVPSSCRCTRQIYLWFLADVRGIKETGATVSLDLRYIGLGRLRKNGCTY